MSILWKPDPAEASTEERFHPDAEVLRCEHAPLHPKFIGHAGLTVSNLMESVEFFRDVIGLNLGPRGIADGMATLEGKVPGQAVALNDFGPAGVHHLAFESAEPFDFESLEQAGVPIEQRRDDPHRRSVFVLDPDGMRLEFFFDPRD
ncbi:MAG: hypothetical protein JOZ39_08270 [Chloroflexi bacterium]|nr:hypothetical protein [Chloroflexota bacterium]